MSHTVVTLMPLRYVSDFDAALGPADMTIAMTTTPRVGVCHGPETKKAWLFVHRKAPCLTSARNARQKAVDTHIAATGMNMADMAHGG